mgnify:CR=1 FL=1
MALTWAATFASMSEAVFTALLAGLRAIPRADGFLAKDFADLPAQSGPFIGRVDKDIRRHRQTRRLPIDCRVMTMRVTGRSPICPGSCRPFLLPNPARRLRPNRDQAI